MLTNLFLLSILPVIASAIPFLQLRALSKDTIHPSQALLLFATGKTPKIPIEDSPITASDRGFYINRPTVGLPCPASAHCNAPTNVTAIIINPNTTARLFSTGPSQNQIFVNGSSGALTYNPTYGTNTTLANFTSGPNGFLFKDPGRADYHTNHTASHSSDIAAGFAATMETAAGQPGKFAFQGEADGEDYAGFDAFWACPDGEEDPIDVYRIFVGDESLGKRCFGIDITTRNLTGEVAAAASAASWGY